MYCCFLLNRRFRCKNGQRRNGICHVDYVARETGISACVQGIELDVRTFNVAIVSTARSDRLIECIHLLDRLLDYGLKPSVSTYTSLIALFCRVGQMQDANLLLEAMLFSGIQPNVVTYSALINGCAREGDVKGALEIFLKMQVSSFDPVFFLFFLADDLNVFRTTLQERNGFFRC